MVNERVNIRDKYRVHKKIIKVLLIIFVVVLILLIAFAAGFLFKKPKTVEVVFENPLKNIILANTNANGEVNVNKVIEQGVMEFNEDYINYILAGLGTDSLHSSILTGNPFLELVLRDEVWSSEIIGNIPKSKIGSIENEDLRITISKDEAVKAILSADIKKFMKDSVANGNTKIEMIAGKVELFSKGYLDMYNKLTE
jgi:hypothetical protein